MDNVLELFVTALIWIRLWHTALDLASG